MTNTLLDILEAAVRFHQFLIWFWSLIRILSGLWLDLCSFCKGCIAGKIQWSSGLSWVTQCRRSAGQKTGTRGRNAKLPMHTGIWRVCANHCYIALMHINFLRLTFRHVHIVVFRLNTPNICICLWQSLKLRSPESWTTWMHCIIVVQLVWLAMTLSFRAVYVCTGTTQQKVIFLLVEQVDLFQYQILNRSASWWMIRQWKRGQR